ncbi:MAG: zinc ribbon domain-containing protein [Candidatus Aminicenantes bacterium]|nr:zinc ribbon domain-containing protein [Candidatus Aminicenantes bacterium]
MPIYEFTCKRCGKRFETLVSIGAEKKVSCLECGSKDVQKLFSSFGIGGGSSRISSSNSCPTCTTTTCSTCK